MDRRKTTNHNAIRLLLSFLIPSLSDVLWQPQQWQLLLWANYTGTFRSGPLSKNKKYNLVLIWMEFRRRGELHEKRGRRMAMLDIRGNTET